MLVRAIEDVVSDPGRMRALAFCVSIRHARFMAEQLSARGIPARAVTADTDQIDRRSALQALRERHVNVL